LAKKKTEREVATEVPETGDPEIVAEDPAAELQQALDEARVEAQRNWDLYLRERAELENARKRHQRDREDAIRFANDRLLKEMIPVLDNLERAIEHAEQGDEESQGLLEGVHMTVTQFRKILEDFGVKRIAALGAPFDPNLHQAMGQLESDEYPPNTVASEFQKGYLLNERLLRPSLVMVAKAPDAAAVRDSGAVEDED
jgi:molecular chaperone GrpE